MPELELAPDIETKFNRLPWCRRASPSTTRHESVKSTDADKLMLNPKTVKRFLYRFSDFAAEAFINGARKTRLAPTSPPAPISHGLTIKSGFYSPQEFRWPDGLDTEGLLQS